MADLELTTSQSSDGWLLHFLKELPAWVIIFMFVVMFLVIWQLSHDDFIPRIIDALVGALLTSIVAQRPKTSPATNITTDSVNAENIEAANTEQGDIVGQPASTLTKNNKE
jgi:hypothetical protein